jgi:hypothetical protein
VTTASGCRTGRRRGLGRPVSIPARETGGAQRCEH